MSQSLTDGDALRGHLDGGGVPISLHLGPARHGDLHAAHAREHDGDGDVAVLTWLKLCGEEGLQILPINADQ